MRDVLEILERHLTPIVAGPGFNLCGDGLASCGDGNLQLLEYQAIDRWRGRLLLDFCHLRDQQLITSELWSPEDLASTMTDPVKGAGAMHRGTWYYDRAGDPQHLAEKICGEVTTWLLQHARTVGDRHA